MTSLVEGVGQGRQAYIHPAKPHSKIHKAPGVMEGGSYLTPPHFHSEAPHHTPESCCLSRVEVDLNALPS